MTEKANLEAIIKHLLNDTEITVEKMVCTWPGRKKRYLFEFTKVEKIKCSEEECKIYGVKEKNKELSNHDVTLVQDFVTKDSKQTCFEVGGNYLPHSPRFLALENAINFIKEYFDGK